MAKFSRSLGILSILLLSYIAISHGLKFKETKYQLLVDPQCRVGRVLGRVRVKGAADVRYEFQTPNKYLEIDTKSGRIKLKDVNLNSGDEKTFWIRATDIDTSDSAKVRLKAIVLDKNPGDQHYLAAIQERVTNPPKHLSPDQMGKAIDVLRAIPDDVLTKSKSKVKRDLITRDIKNKIKKQHKCKGCRVFLAVCKLLSKPKKKKIDDAEPCEDCKSITCDRHYKYRTSDGTCNNLHHPFYGAAGTTFVRLLDAKYYDEPYGLGDPLGYPNQPNAPDVPSPFEISQNFIIDEVAQSSSESTDATHAVMQFGQFLDHDLDLAVDSEGSKHCEHVSCNETASDFMPPCFPILPEGENGCIRIVRSAAGCKDGVREQLNAITAYIDASQVYGSHDELADYLRDATNGLMRTSSGPGGEFLPLDTRNNAPTQMCDNLGGCFIAGDIRANEQGLLASIHTLLLREHNRIANELASMNPHWDSDQIYQETRKIIGAILQKITNKDWLTVILGPGGLPCRYRGYRSLVNAGISNVFATGAFRFGHSLIRPAFTVLNNNFDPVDFGSVSLRFMFFNNTLIQNGGIEGLLFGAVGNATQTVDRTLAPGLVRHLFERDNSPGLNLAAMNIQRSRDHGLPSYNEFRKYCGLGDAKTFNDTRDEITNSENREILKVLYDDNPDLADLWVAGLAEAPTHGGMVGPTFRCLLIEQFCRTRDGDRFYYEKPGVFSKDQLKEIEKSSMSRLYCNNLHDIVSIQPDAFRIPDTFNQRRNCDEIPGMDLSHWQESPNPVVT